MKKEYKTPSAEKVEFDYTDTVVACSDFGYCNNQQQQGSDVSNPHWECKSPDHWGC